MQFVTTLQAESHDISEFQLPNKDIKGILALSKQPNTSYKAQKGYFYAFNSPQLNEIKVAFEAIARKPPEDLQGDKWVAKIAQYIKDIKWDRWHNSFVDLPDARKTPPNNILLLWRLDEGFSEKFYNTTSPAKSTRAGRANG